MKLSSNREGANPATRRVENRSVYAEGRRDLLSRLLFLLFLFSGCVGGPVPDPPNIESIPTDNAAPRVNPESVAPTSTSIANTAGSSDTPLNGDNEPTVPSSLGGTSGSQDSSNNAGVWVDGGIGEGGRVPELSADASAGEPTGAAPRDEEDYPPFDPLNIENLQVNSTGGLFPWLNRQSVMVIQGKPDALLPEQSLWVFNLDSDTPPSIATAAEDGSFEIQISYNLGDVLRFQVRQGDIFYEPADLELSQESMTLVPIEQVDCVSIPTQLTLEESAPLYIDNQCEQAITVRDIAWRAADVPIAVDDSAGVVIDPASGREIMLSVTSDEIDPWINEDILLITIDWGSEEIRFATGVTIR